MRLFNDLLFVFLAFLHAVPEVFLQLLLDTLSDLLLANFSASFPEAFWDRLTDAFCNYPIKLQPSYYPSMP